MVKFAIVIVAYNPTQTLIKNLKLFEENELVKDVIIVDNTSIQTEINEKITAFNKVSLIAYNDNLGLGKAQKDGLNKVISLGYDWVITFDQDSEITSDLLFKYNKYINENDCENVAIINSDFIDRGKNQKNYDNQDVLSVDEVVSSGSLINLKIYQKVGEIREEFFIDQIDNEYCYRVKSLNYEIRVLPDIGFYHQMGEIRRVKLLNFYVYNQSPLRVYYRTRNLILFYKAYKDKKLKRKNKKAIFFDFIKIFFEKQKFKKIKMYFIGINHGLKNKTGKYEKKSY